jgi:hypothetical protein
MAAAHGLLTTGGSDFHADPASSLTIGASALPSDEWQRLYGARGRHRAS